MRFNPSNRSLALIISLLAVAGIVITVVGVSILSAHPLFMSQESLTTSYNKPYGLKAPTASFNHTNTHDQVAWFSMNFQNNNQTYSPVGLQILFAGNFGFVVMDSMTLAFVSDQSGYTVEAAQQALFTAPSVTQVTLTRGIMDEKVSYSGLAASPQGTITEDLWWKLGGMSSQSGNHTVTLIVDLTAHDAQSSLIGHSYLAEAIFHIVIQPDGLIYVSDG